MSCTCLQRILHKSHKMESFPLLANTQSFLGNQTLLTFTLYGALILYKTGQYIMDTRQLNMSGTILKILQILWHPSQSLTQLNFVSFIPIVLVVLIVIDCKYIFCVLFWKERNWILNLELNLESTHNLM